MMKRYFVVKRYFILVCVAMASASLLWGCSELMEDAVAIDGDKPSKPGKPTVPIKRRPIVPTTKLPRPRVAIDVEWKASNMLAIKLSEPVSSAEVVVTDVESGASVCHMFDGVGVEIAATAEVFTLEVNIDGEEHMFLVGDSDNSEL